MAADATTLSTADNTDPFIPRYTDGTPIVWDGNYAHIDGALYETGRALVGLATTKEHRALVLRS